MEGFWWVQLIVKGCSIGYFIYLLVIKVVIIIWGNRTCSQ